MTKAVEIQVISSSVAPTAPRMCVRATLTIEASIAPIRVPKETDTVTSHLLVGARGDARDRGIGIAAASLIYAPAPCRKKRTSAGARLARGTPVGAYSSRDKVPFRIPIKKEGKSSAPPGRGAPRVLPRVGSSSARR